MEKKKIIPQIKVAYFALQIIEGTRIASVDGRNSVNIIHVQVNYVQPPSIRI